MAYLEKKLKLRVNTEQSRAVSVYSSRDFGIFFVAKIFFGRIFYL